MKYRKRLHRPHGRMLPHLFKSEDPLDQVVLLESLGVARVWWLDSSPQAGVDWMVISSFEINMDDISKVIKCRRDLALISNSPEDDGNNESSIADLEDRRSNNTYPQQNLKMERVPTKP
eukprot:2747840-Pyramimonas_sp.AAC.1